MLSALFLGVGDVYERTETGYNVDISLRLFSEMSFECVSKKEKCHAFVVAFIQVTSTDETRDEYENS